MFSDIFDFSLMSCMGTDGAVDESIDDDAPIVVEMNKQFSSPGSVVNLSGQDLSDWVSMQSLCARLSRSDNAKSIIYLDHCSLGRHGAAIISRTFTHVLIRAGNYVAKWLPLMNQNGRILVLSMINNDVGPDGAAAVSKMLRINTGLRELNLRFNALGSDGAQYLASALYVNDGLRFICLSCNEICGLDSVGDGDYDLTGFAALMRALQVNTKVRTIKLAENDIGGEGARHVADALRENSRLMVVDLHGNNLFAGMEKEEQKEQKGQKEMMTIDVSAMDESMSSSSSVGGNEDGKNDAAVVKSVVNGMIEIAERRNNIAHSLPSSPQPSTHKTYAVIREDRHLRESGGGGEELLRSIGASSVLSSTDLSWNDLGPRGAHILTNAILANASSFLSYLDIHGNPLTDEGMRSISTLLEHPTCKISTLNLQLVGMGPRGASYLGGALALNSSLTKLNISSNIIEALGSEKLSLGLRTNQTVAELNLRQCGLCAEGIAHIANMLQYNTSLTSLNLSSNAIDDDGATSLAATIAINQSLQTLDLSNYVKTFVPPLHFSSTPAKSSQQPNSPEKKVKVHRKSKTKPSYGRIEESGMEVLALSIRSNQVHLKKLILKGHWLTPKSEDEILSAIDFRRICSVDACFPTMEERHKEIVDIMNGEREVLTSCYTPSFLRVHVCGQEGDAKKRLLQGWSQGKGGESSGAMEGHHQLSQVQPHQGSSSTSFYTNMFAASPASAPDIPGIAKTTLHLKERINLLQNSVDPALEVGLWSYMGGHDFHNIFRLHMRGSPLGVGIVCASMVGNDSQCRSAGDIAQELYSWISLLLTYGHNARDIGVVFTNGAAFDKAWKGLNPLIGQRVPGGDADSRTDKSFDTDEMNESRRSVESCGSLHSVSLVDRSDSPDDKASGSSEGAKEGKKENAEGKEEDKSIEALLDRSIHSSYGQEEDAASDSSSPATTTEGGSRQESSLVRRKFEESIRESLSTMFGDKLIPQLFTWDDGRTICGMHPKVESWLRERYRSLAKHVRVPTVCKILREKCLPLLRSRRARVIDINELLKEGQKHVRCLQNLELRHACQWLHQLGDVVVVDVSVEGFSVHPATENKSLPGNDDTKTENKLFKIILDPAWFSAYALMPIVSLPSSLPLALQSTQLWGGKEYLISTQHIREFSLASDMHSQLGMTHNELLLVLEHFRIGIVLTCRSVSRNMVESVLFVPSRIPLCESGGKLEWLRGRGVAQISLSQSSSEEPAVTAVLARRVAPRKPFIIPPCFFSCVQAEVLCAFECGGRSSFAEEEGYQVMCWDKGLGIWRDELGKSGGVLGTVCVLIECTPKWVHNNWAQDPECAVDVIAWGEGRCSAEAVVVTLSRVMEIIQAAGDIVLNGSLRSKRSEPRGGRGDESLLVENPYTPSMPMINWLRVLFLRPGCVMHTLALSPGDRDCAECAEDDDTQASSGSRSSGRSSGSSIPNYPSSPVLVSCHHPQPRLTRGALETGYILADSPGGGRGLLRSISGSLSGLTVESSGGRKAVHIYDHPHIEFQFDSSVASE